MNSRYLPDQAQAKESSPRQSGYKDDIPGKLSEHIGSGKHAQAAIAWNTIKWSFLAGAFITAAFLFWAWLTDASELPMGSIRDVWAIFAPIITLSIGYMFGKGT